MNVLYDAGLLVAADRNDRRVWAQHRVRLELGIVPVTTAPVVAQVSRSSRQVQLSRLLRGCQVEPFGTDDAHAVGALLGSSGTSDVVDAHLVLVAASGREVVQTSDPGDMQRLSSALQAPVQIREIASL